MISNVCENSDKATVGLLPYTAIDLEISLNSMYIKVFELISILCLYLCSFNLLADTDILILQSHDSLPYQQTLAGFKSSINSHSDKINYQVQIINNDVNTKTQLTSLINTYSPKLILSLGSPATHIALELDQEIPVVAGLIINTNEFKSHKKMTSVTLTYSANIHWYWFRRLLPESSNVILIYDPKYGTDLAQSLQHLAHLDGVNFLLAPASNAEELLKLMQNFPSQLDAIWTVNSASAFTPVAVRELLLYSFRNRTPLVGLSAQWVKSGAFYALDWDYADLGAQNAEQAWQILQKSNQAAQEPNNQNPRKVRPVINIKTANHMKLQDYERWLAEIAEVFE